MISSGLMACKFLQKQNLWKLLKMYAVLHWYSNSLLYFSTHVFPLKGVSPVPGVVDDLSAEVPDPLLPVSSGCWLGKLWVHRAGQWQAVGWQRSHPSLSGLGSVTGQLKCVYVPHRLEGSPAPAHCRSPTRACVSLSDWTPPGDYNLLEMSCSFVT